MINIIDQIKLTQLSYMSRVLPLYSTINPERVDPQFIGIGQKYNEHKRNRLNSDQKYRSVSSNYAYTLKMNSDLEKNLEEKEIQLERLRKIRQRHNQDVKNKIEEQQRRKQKLEQLKQFNRKKREQNKANLKNAKETMHTSRINNKNQIKQQLYQGKLLFQACYETQQNEKAMKYRSIQFDHQSGNEMINSFYRKKNHEQVIQYKSMIQEEDSKSQDNNLKIRKMKNHMSSLQKSIQKKQKKLKQVLDQIHSYAVQTPNQRKIEMLTTISFFKNSTRDQSTRSHRSSASKRSKPSQILKMSINKEINIEK